MAAAGGALPGGPEGAAPAGPRPRRRWLWLSLGLLLPAALFVGVVLRAGTGGGGLTLAVMGAAGMLAVLFVAAEILVVLQGVQAREAGAAALAALPPSWRVTGRTRIRGHGPRPVVADHVVVGPHGTAFAVVVDGSTRPPAPGDRTDGVGPLLRQARLAAEAVAAAARAGVLPERVGIAPGARVHPCVLVARRPFRSGARDGVLAVGTRDLPEALEEAAEAARR